MRTNDWSYIIEESDKLRRALCWRDVMKSIMLLSTINMCCFLYMMRQVKRREYFFHIVRVLFVWIFLWIMKFFNSGKCSLKGDRLNKLKYSNKLPSKNQYITMDHVLAKSISNNYIIFPSTNPIILRGDLRTLVIYIRT